VNEVDHNQPGIPSVCVFLGHDADCARDWVALGDELANPFLELHP
jgi:hypothetical protein